MDSSIMDLHSTELKAQSSNSTNSTSAAAERREISFLEKARVELQNIGRYTKDHFKMQKQAFKETSSFFGIVTEASKGFNFNMHELKETSSLIVNAIVRESSDECHNTSNPSAKNKISLIGVRRQKNGRYGAVITDTIRRKQVWLGTFDTIEEASHAYLSKKSEFESEFEQIQQSESPVVAPLSVANDQTLDTTSHVRRRNERIDSHEITHIVEVHKNKMSGNYTSEIRNPTSKKRIWLWTFGTTEDASQASQSKMLEFQKLVKEKQQQCTNKQRIDSHEIGTAREAFNAYQAKIFDFQSSKKVELQSNMATDYSAGGKQEGQKDEDLWMGEWVQLPGNREVKYSLKLGLPIIDNYGSLLGEFSTLDDLNIC